MYYTYVYYDIFNNDFGEYAKERAPSLKNSLIDDTWIAVILCLVVWLVFSLLNKVFLTSHERIRKVKGYILYGTVFVIIYSLIKSVLSNDHVTLLLNRISNRIYDKIDYYRWRLMFLKHNYIVRRISRLGKKLNKISNSDNLIGIISESFVFVFLILVLLIFFVITKCTNDSRSLILFIFKDFLFICILSGLFLILRRNFLLSPFKWQTFTDDIWWKY